MTYSSTEPQDLPPPVVATVQMKTNFAQFQTVFTNNHVALNNSSQGKHGKVVFEAQTSDPGVTGNYDAVYCKSVTNTSSTQPQAFLQIPQFLPNNQPNTPQQITFDSVNTAGPDYHTFLPGGYIMFFGSVNAVPTTITLNPIGKGITSVIVNPNNLTSIGQPVPFDAYATVLNATQFVINSGYATGVYTFTWVAICEQ